MKENYTKFCYQIIHKMFFLLFLFLLLCPNVRADLKEDKEDKLEKISISIRSISSENFPPNKYSNFIAIPFDFVLSIWARLLLFCGCFSCSLPSIHLHLIPDKIVINDGRLSRKRFAAASHLSNCEMTDMHVNIIYLWFSYFSISSHTPRSQLFSLELPHLVVCSFKLSRFMNEQQLLYSRETRETFS